MFSPLRGPKAFRGVAPACVDAMNRAMCFVVRLVVGPRPLRLSQQPFRVDDGRHVQILSKPERILFETFCRLLAH
jgi:hypothetical protein